jgi:hypothetical protein
MDEFPLLLHANRYIDKHEEIHKCTSVGLRTGRNEIQTNGTVAQKKSESIFTTTIIETWVLAATVVCLLILLSRYN